MIKFFKKIVFKCRIWIADDYKLAKLYSKRYGIKMGSNVRITGKVFWDTEPYLIEIGNNVSLTQNIRFITHGGVSIFRKEYPGINYFARIKIGDNVIIGASTIILPDVSIGNNSIIGAGSVVTKSIPPNVVAAGNPAKVIFSMEEYKNKKLKQCVFIFEKDPAKRKAEIIMRLEEKEKEQNSK
jgi:acetyltransferase-like isoleucine patch superfamily enzyme